MGRHGGGGLVLGLVLGRRAKMKAGQLVKSINLGAMLP